MNRSHQYHMLKSNHVRPVKVIGAGSIAGWAVLALAKAGVDDITVYDHDVVASHNIPMSVYRESDIGRHKVDALYERIKWETGLEIKIRGDRYSDQHLGRCSVLSCVDTNDTGRTPIWEQVKDSLQVDIMVDTRIHRWFGEIYTIVPTLPEDIENYEPTIKPDSEMALQECGYHGIAPMAMSVAGDAVNSLFRYWNEGVHTWRVSNRYDRLRSA